MRRPTSERRELPANVYVHRRNKDGTIRYAVRVKRNGVRKDRMCGSVEEATALAIAERGPAPETAFMQQRVDVCRRCINEAIAMLDVAPWAARKRLEFALEFLA